MNFRHLPLLLLPLALAACGGGGDSASDTSSDTKSEETVAAVTLSVLDASSTQSDTLDSASSGIDSKAYTGIRCETGTVTHGSGSSADVGSPYTDATFSTDGTTVENCAFDYDVDTGRVDSVGTQTLDGELLAGTAADAEGSYAFIRIGESLSMPVLSTLDSSTTFSSASQTVTLQTHVDDQSYLRIDRKVASGDVFEEWTISQSGNFDITGSGGYARDGGYELSMGVEDAPFLHSRTNAGATFDGVFHYSVSQQNVPDECASTTLTVETLEPLIASDDEDAPYASGELLITDADGDATEVVFNGDGTVTVSDEDSSQTLQYAPLMAVADECTAALSAAAQARAAY